METTMRGGIAVWQATQGRSCISLEVTWSDEDYNFLEEIKTEKPKPDSLIAIIINQFFVVF